MIWITDAKSLHDVLVKDAGRPADKRVRILVSALRQSLQEDGITALWVDTAVMMADTLTKDIEPRIRDSFLAALVSCRWSIEQPLDAKAAKSRIAANRQARRAAARV